MVSYWEVGSRLSQLIGIQMARNKRRRARKKGRAKRIARVQQVMADKAAEEMRIEGMEDAWQERVDGFSTTGRWSASKPNLQQIPRTP